MADPATCLNCNSSPVRYTLFVYGTICIGKLVIMIHDEDGGAKENIFVENDLVLAGYR